MAQPRGPPSKEEIMLEKVLESCPFKFVLSGAMGFVLGGAFGFIMGGVNTNPALMNEDPTKLKFRDVMRATGKQTWSYSRSFGMVGALYAGSECVIESYRAKHDMVNSISAGCFTGAALAVRAGPQAAALGCAGFAAFSAAIDYFLESNH